MKKIILIALAALLLLPALPGGAQDVSYVGESSTAGLSISVTDQGLRTGVISTRVQSSSTEECAGTACASAAGAAEPVGTTVTATTPGEGNPDPVASGSIGDADPQLEQILRGDFGTATATTTATTALGNAQGFQVDVTLTQTLVNPLPAEITGPLNDGIAQIADGLTPIAENDPTGVIAGVSDALTGLVGNLGASPILSVQGAESNGDSDFTDGRVNADAMASGAILVLLPAVDRRTG